MRLIDADAFERHVYQEWVNGEISNSEWVDFRQWLRDETTIDAVPVVRCGECKWLFNDSNTFFKPCEVIIPEKDWYCAYGERREG